MTTSGVQQPCISCLEPTDQWCLKCTYAGRAIPLCAGFDCLRDHVRHCRHQLTMTEADDTFARLAKSTLASVVYRPQKCACRVRGGHCVALMVHSSSDLFEVVLRGLGRTSHATHAFSSRAPYTELRALLLEYEYPVAALDEVARTAAPNNVVLVGLIGEHVLAWEADGAELPS